MSFVRKKEIPPGSGNWYDYEVETYHDGPHVRQRVLQYLGKSGNAHSKPLLGGTRRKDLQIPSKTLSPKVIKPKVACKICDSQNTRKYGLYKGVQNYFCNDCKTKFTGTDALSHGRVSPEYIATALNEFYSGMSFHEIEDGIEQKTKEQISHTAVIKWVNKFTNKAINQTKALHPKVGDTWIADETYLHTDVKTRDPKGVVFWDIIDSDTRFLLATIVTTTRNKQDAKRLMELAAKRAGKVPKVVVTDKLGAYIDGIELAYGSDTKHRQGGPFEVMRSGDSTSKIERFHNSLKFFRPNMALENRPPAVVAGLNYESYSWADVVGIKKIPLVQTLEPKILT